jgi:hypothetical protein
MEHYPEVGRASALVIMIAGLLICFWGYRILKLSLAVIGFIAGAFGGWQLGLSLATGGSGTALVCALIGGVVGIVLCLWLYFVGIFLIGATAGMVVAAAFFSGIGHQIQPIVFLVFTVAFGVIAVLAQKFMIILSTAVSGAYLVTAGIWPFVLEDPNVSRVWLHPDHNGSTGTLGYGALLLWAFLALLGTGTQLRSGRKKADVEVVKTDSKQ